MKNDIDSSVCMNNIDSCVNSIIFKILQMFQLLQKEELLTLMQQQTNPVLDMFQN